MFRSPLVNDEHALAFVLFAPFVVAQFAFLNLDMILVGQPPQCLWIGHLLVFHDKAHGGATLSTTKAMANATRRRHHKRRCALVMKRAQPLIIRPSLAQGYELGNHIHDVGCLLYLLYGCSVYHVLFQLDANGFNRNCLNQLRSYKKRLKQTREQPVKSRRKKG